MMRTFLIASVALAFLAPAGVAGAAPRSDETRFVRSIYRHYLRRAPEASELNYWLERFTEGTTFLQAEAQILGSPTYYTEVGRGELRRWFRAAYSDVLGRVPEPREVRDWLKEFERISGPGVEEEWIYRKRLMERFLTAVRPERERRERGRLPAARYDR